MPTSLCARARASGGDGGADDAPLHTPVPAPPRTLPRWHTEYRLFQNKSALSAPGDRALCCLRDSGGSRGGGRDGADPLPGRLRPAGGLRGDEDRRRRAGFLTVYLVLTPQENRRAATPVDVTSQRHGPGKDGRALRATARPASGRLSRRRLCAQPSTDPRPPRSPSRPAPGPQPLRTDTNQDVLGPPRPWGPGPPRGGVDGACGDACAATPGSSFDPQLLVHADGRGLGPRRADSACATHGSSDAEDGRPRRDF